MSNPNGGPSAQVPVEGRQPDDLVKRNDEKIVNTRKELWDNLFLFVDFSRMKEQYPNM